MKYATELNKRQSQRVIEQAIRLKAPVLIEPRTLDNLESIKGCLQDGQPDTLLIQFAEEPIPAAVFIPTSYCEGRLFVGDNRYLFTTNVLELDTRDELASLTVVRPETIQVLQRRKFWRASLHESSEVRFSWKDEGANSHTAGQLLNLSPDGLACRLSRDAADAILIGDPIEASFQLPSCDHLFELTGVLCNKTPGGSPDTMIVGLQFVVDQHSRPDIELLRDYLFGEFAGHVGEEAAE